jgi:SAM-dependent methyltransferase
MDIKDQALLALGKELQARNYKFTTITPGSHRRVNGRKRVPGAPLDRLFGWSLPVERTEIAQDIASLLVESGEGRELGDKLFSNVRFSTLGSQLFAHSAFPTDASDTVFFGPDTYRFARTLRCALETVPVSHPLTLVDIGCGSGAGGIHAAACLTGRVAAEVIMSDINPQALRYSKINALLNEVINVRAIRSDIFRQIDKRANIVISNPPYLVDRAQRLYRHGGGELGSDLSVRIVEESLDRLLPAGMLLLYTGAPIINGKDRLFMALEPLVNGRVSNFTYEEIDPDVFGEELESAPYDVVDRIAAVVLTVHI